MDDLKRLGKLISKINLDAPEGLSERILSNIKEKERRADLWRATFYSALSAISVSLLYFSSSFAVGEFYRSGAAQILSLLFSDFQSMVANWQDFSLSLAESLPVLPLVYMILSVSALIIFAALAITNVRKFEQLKHNYFKHA
ncbi:MAG: hypothetical protein M1334_03870 [Patescibacteria group bacterium]|nr:hypothetical protein [Patescibacteria group bacterium]